MPPSSRKRSYWLIAALAAVSLATSDDARSEDRTISNWTTNPWPGQHRTAEASVENEAIGLDFPTDADHQLNALVADVSVAGRPSQDGSITIAFEITGAGEFHHDDPGTAPARVHVIIQRRGDDLRTPDGRWWSPGIELMPGVVERTFLLADLDWANVYGRRASDRTDAFLDAIEKAGVIGFTFGGGNSNGHGIWIEGGSARMTVTGFEVD